MSAWPRARTLVVLAGVGCGKASPPAPGSGAAPPAHVVPGDAARWQECTEAARAPMEAALLRRAHLEKIDERIDGLTCVTIQLAHQPAFFVELVGEISGSRDDQRRRLHGVIAIDGATELVGLRDASLDWAQLRGGKNWFETIDLDGDGTEELVVHRGDERHPTAEWIDLIAIRGAGFAELAGPRIAYDDPDLDVACVGSLKTQRIGAKAYLVVTETSSSGASEHCPLAVGRHEYALEADRLVELGPP